MTIWKVLSILGLGAALILLGLGMALPEQQAALTAVAAATGAANFSLLAILVDKITANQKK